jgi:hypothetical protein
MKTLDIDDLAVLSECLQALYEDAKLGKEGYAVHWDDDSWDAIAHSVLTAAEVCGIVLVDK